MFEQHRAKQFATYSRARTQLVAKPNVLIDLERFLTDYLVNTLKLHLPEIRRDYDEASYLYPFWQQYPPDDRGRAPVGDQYPWIEVGEHALGAKLPRFLSSEFQVSDPGLPTGADERFVLRARDVLRMTAGLTDAVWLFVDIKSVGPRDDQDHTVMSHNQVSGDGTWTSQAKGIRNSVLKARGTRTSHDFHCSIPPLYVLSDGSIVPVVIVALKPVYKMLPSPSSARTIGQPLERIDVACIPNGLLLTENPAYLKTHPGLLFPGKDDKGKNPLKVRARVSFEILRALGYWRHQKIC